MAWPTVNIDTSDMDAGTDSAGNARGAIKQMADNVNNIKDARGTADGIASLDAGGKVPTDQLPTMPAGQGGTGQAGGYTVGDLLYASAVAALSKLPAGGAGLVLTSNGPGAAPSWQQAGGVPSGARMVFNMTTPPLGWTKDTTAALDDSILRIVTGTVSSGGSQAFSTWNARTSTSAHTLTSSQMPSHNHTQRGGTTTGTTAGQLRSTDLTSANSYSGGSSTASTGSGSSHSHGLTQNIKYHDFIVAQKD